MMDVIVVIVMVVGYSIAILMIARIFMIAATLHTEVPFVPTDKFLLKKSLEMMNLRDGQKVVDLGSGDGRFIVYAARRFPKVNFVGIELNRGLVRFSQFRARALFLKNVKFLHANMYEYDISSFDAIYIYLTSGFISRLMTEIVDNIKSGAIVLSSHFGFGETFEKNHEVIEYKVQRVATQDRISTWTKP